ncbi:hypothetical protein Acin_0657 [Acidaminococcus intestini RyC-MR95]|uniref:Uncharacterized protein n=1 Tax=Acidaminococcus intestini (strain RyC-MR95) TaxID=568816 RepID=G4Q4A1_ACIIR|nr:hypothetical protein Acin_0657 [Acidaminococcus intestini RyC-MR95]
MNDMESFVGAFAFWKKLADPKRFKRKNPCSGILPFCFNHVG